MDTMNDDEFFAFCEANRLNGMHFERDKYGHIIFMSPPGTIGGARDLDIAIEVGYWAKQNKTGVAFGPATGFTLPDSSISCLMCHGFEETDGSKYLVNYEKNLLPSVLTLW